MGIGSVTRSSFTNVPFVLSRSRTMRPPLAPTVSSAWMRETIVSEGSTGWISHSRPRPKRIRTPRASYRRPVAAASSVTP